MRKFFIAFSLLLTFIDRVSKTYIQTRPNLYSGGFIKLKLLKNTKFYFFSFGEYTNIIISIISAIVLTAFIFLLFKYYNKFLLLNGFLLIILGGASNLFDRLYYGYVVDFIKISILPFSIFNIADILIILGIIFIIPQLREQFS